MNYLIQPAELVGTNRYKVGTSAVCSSKRIETGYKNGTRILCLLKSNNHSETEKLIKNAFNIDFIKCAGTEFYEGDKNLMLQKFVTLSPHHPHKTLFQHTLQNQY